MYRSMCQLLLNKPHNGLEVTHAEFFRRGSECTIGFDGEEIQLSLISLWEKFVAYR